MTMAPERPQLSVLSGLVQGARPKQWPKNLLVFVAPAAAAVLDEWPSLWRAVVVFVAMCAAASGTYLVNDVADVESDRRHPVKRYRPVASGVVPIPLARNVGIAFMALALVLAALTLHWGTVAVVGLYLALTISYSVRLKRIPVIDLLTVAAGFVLRAVAGAVAVDVPMSRWFLLCISFGSLFIVAGKRYAELRQLGDAAATIRPTLDRYSVVFLRVVLAAAVAGTVLSYGLWVHGKVASAVALPWPVYQLSIIPLVGALVRYGVVLESGRGSAPEEVFLTDRPLAAFGLLWVAMLVMASALG